MRRTFLILCLLLSWSGTAWAQGSPSSLPLAGLPLDGNDAVWVDQGTGCPNQPCTSKKSPSTRVGQPVQQAMAPVNPFAYQQWIDTSQNPPQLKQFFGSIWHLAATLDPINGYLLNVPASAVTGLGTMATQNANAVAITGGSIKGMPTPTAAADVATKAYVDAKANGIIFQQAVKYATAAILPNTPVYNNGTAGVGAILTAGSNTTLTVDGNVVALNDRVLVKSQADQTQNGTYSLTQAGDGSHPWILTRVTDWDQAAEMQTGSWFLVTNGSSNAASSWVLNTAQPVVVGSTALTFAQAGASQSYTADGTTLQLIGSQFSIKTTGVAANTYGSATQVPSFTVSPTGQLSAASNVSIAIPASAVTSGSFGLARGGTGSDLSGTGGAHQVLLQSLAGAAITVGRLACADLSDAVASCVIDATNASNIVTGTLAVAQGGTGDAGTPWASYTLAVSCSGGGSPMTISASTPRYKTLGKTVYLQVQFVVSGKSTCGNDVLSLPVLAANDAANQSFQIAPSVGGVAASAPNTTNLTLSPPLAGAGTYYISGVYESN